MQEFTEIIWNLQLFKSGWTLLKTDASSLFLLCIKQCRVIHLLQSKVTAKPCQTTAMMLCTLSTDINTWNSTRKTKVGPRESSVYISFPLYCRFLVNCMDLALFPDGYQILRLLDTNMIFLSMLLCWRNIEETKAAERCVGFCLTDQSKAAVVQRAGSGLKCHLSHEYNESSLQNKVQEGDKWRTSGMVIPNFLNRFCHLQLIPPPQRTLPWVLVPHTGNQDNILTWKYFVTQNEGARIFIMYS